MPPTQVPVSGTGVASGGTGGAAGAVAGGAGGASGVGGAIAPPDAGMPTPDAGPDDPGTLNTAPAMFGQNVKVSDDTGRGQQMEVVLAAHPSGLLLAGFMDQRGGQGRCGFAWSQDGGETWSETMLVATQASSGGAFAGDPAAAIDDAGNMYAVCQDYASGGLGTNYILFAHSKDKGETWTEFERVNQSLDKPWVGATEDGIVYLSWLGQNAGAKMSEDYGETWSQPVSFGYINHGTGFSTGTGGIVHIGYNVREDTVHYSRSSDYLRTLDVNRDITEQGRPCRSPCSPRSHPIVGNASDPTGKIVALTWAATLSHPDAEGDDDVWVVVSTDGGDTFGDPIRVNDNTSPSRQFQPWVAVDKYGAVHVTWTDLRGGNNSTYYARMVDFDAGFEPNVEVTDMSGDVNGFLGDYKGIAVHGRDVLVLWTDTRNDMGDVYFARAVDAAAAGGPLYEAP